MSAASELRERLRALFRRGDAESELDAELRFHIEMQTQENLRRGMEPEEARREAALAFGGVERVKEEVRDARGLGIAEIIARDIRMATRRLLRDRGYSVPVVVTLTLGIGVGAAVFALVYAVLIQPLPYPAPDRLVAIEHAAPGADLPMGGLSGGTFLHYRRNNRVFEEMAVYLEQDFTLTGQGEPERVGMAMVSPGLFSVLRVSPFLGRLPTAADFQLGVHSGVVIAYDLWVRRYGADRGIIGRTIRIEGQPSVVVGVMRPGFRFPDTKTQVWIAWPQEKVPGNDRASVRGLYMSGIGRLRPGVSVEAAEQDLQRLVQSLPDAFPDVSARQLSELRLRAVVIPLKEAFTGDVRVTLLLLLATAGFLLLITWANTINLCLVRAGRQRREVTVARALGAGGARLASRFATESVMLAAAGSLLGLALASAAVRTRFGFEPGQIPRLDEVRVDWKVVGLVLVLALLSALLLAGVSLLRTRSADLASALKSSLTRVTAGERDGALRRVLVTIQVALALTLLISAGLMARSYWGLSRVTLGFTPSGIVTFRLPVPANVYSNYHAMARVHHEVLSRLRALPGVETAEAADVSGFPLTPVPDYYKARIAAADGAGAADGKEWAFALFGFATPGYFQAMHIPILRGRSFQWEDTGTEGHGVILSQALARALFGAADPVGRQVRWAKRPQGPAYRVVGVVGDVPSERLRDGPSRVLYFPNIFPPKAPVITGVVHDYVPDDEMYVVRTDLSPSALAPEIRRAVHEVDPELVVTPPAMLDQLVAASRAQARLMMLLLLIAAGTALCLGVIGIYGVLAYSVSQRTAELGLRIALGAEPAAVVRMVVRQGAQLAGVGIALGLLSAALLSRLLASLLYGVKPTDPVSFAAMAGLLFGVALAASYLPARRAQRIEPAEVLRAE